VGGGGGGGGGGGIAMGEPMQDNVGDVMDETLDGLWEIIIISWGVVIWSGYLFWWLAAA